MPHTPQQPTSKACLHQLDNTTKDHAKDRGVSQARGPSELKEIVLRSAHDRSQQTDRPICVK